MIRCYETQVDLGDLGDHEALVDAYVNISPDGTHATAKIMRVVVTVRAFSEHENCMKVVSKIDAVNPLYKINLLNEWVIQDLEEEVIKHAIENRDEVEYERECHHG